MCLFAQLKPDEQRNLVLCAANWAIHARAHVGDLSRALLAFFAQEMGGPR